jgi:hypothetical protein
MKVEQEQGETAQQESGSSEAEQQQRSSRMYAWYLDSRIIVKGLMRTHVRGVLG